MPEVEAKPVYLEPEVATPNLFMTLAEGLKGPAKYPNAFVDGLPNGLYFTKGIPVNTEVSEGYRQAFQTGQIVNANHIMITPDGVFQVTSPTRIAVDPLVTDINPVIRNSAIAGTSFPISEACNDPGGNKSTIGVRRLDLTGSENDKRLVTLVLSETNRLNPPVVTREVTAESVLADL